MRTRHIALAFLYRPTAKQTQHISRRVEAAVRTLAASVLPSRESLQTYARRHRQTDGRRTDRHHTDALRRPL